MLCFFGGGLSAQEPGYGRYGLARAESYSFQNGRIVPFQQLPPSGGSDEALASERPDGAQQEVQLYRDPSMIVRVMACTSFAELNRISQHILQAMAHYNGLDVQTLLPLSEAYFEALKLLNKRGGLGFGATLKSRVSIDAESFEPMKQHMLEYFMVQLFSKYMSQEEVFHSIRLLGLYVASGELSLETRRNVLDVVVSVHLQLGRNMDEALYDELVRPILMEDEALKQEYEQRLRKDILTEPLFSEDELEAIQKAAIKKLRKRGVAKRTIVSGLISQREGAIADDVGKNEEDVKRGRRLKKRTRRIK